MLDVTVLAASLALSIVVPRLDLSYVPLSQHGPSWHHSKLNTNSHMDCALMIS